MRARGDHRHQDRIGREHMEQRQRAHHAIGFLEQQTLPQPAVIDHAGKLVLRDLGHPRRPARMEIGGDAVFLPILEGQPVRRLPRQFCVEIQNIGRMADRVLGPDQRHDPGFRRGEVAHKIHLQHRLDRWRMLHRLGNLLRHVGLGKGLQRDHDLGLRLAQDGADLFGLQQGVDRVHDPRHRPAQQGDGGLKAVGQHIGHHVLFTHAKAAEKVRRLRHLAVQRVPGQRLGLFLRAGQDLIADRGSRPMGRLRPAKEFMHRARHAARLPRHFRLDRLHIRKIGEFTHVILPLMAPLFLPGPFKGM